MALDAATRICTCGSARVVQWTCHGNYLVVLIALCFEHPLPAILQGPEPPRHLLPCRCAPASPRGTLQSLCCVCSSSGRLRGGCKSGQRKGGAGAAGKLVAGAAGQHLLECSPRWAGTSTVPARTPLCTTGCTLSLAWHSVRGPLLYSAANNAKQGCSTVTEAALPSPPLHTHVHTSRSNDIIMSQQRKHICFFYDTAGAPGGHFFPSGASAAAARDQACVHGT